MTADPRHSFETPTPIDGTPSVDPGASVFNSQEHPNTGPEPIQSSPDPELELELEEPLSPAPSRSHYQPAQAPNSQYGRRQPPPPAAEKPTKRKGCWSYFKDFTYELCKIIAIVLILRAYVLQASTVDGQSMEPTLHNGDYLLVERLTISLQNLPEVIRGVVPDALIPSIERGDIVVLSSPENGNNELVKRVVAIGGDSFFFADGRIWVNGEPAEENFLSDEQRKRIGRTGDGTLRHYHESDIFGMPNTYKVSTSELSEATTNEDRRKLGVKIPEGCLFVMGDNRESSKDSRAWARTEIHSDSPGSNNERTNHLWATVRSVHGRVLMRLRLPWDYDAEHPVFPK
jgi:signal peptidase I